MYLDKDKNIGTKESASKAFQNSLGVSYSYTADCGIKILKCPENIQNLLLTLDNHVHNTLNELKLHNKYESQVAHYSRSSTAFEIIGIDKTPSALRLSTVRGVNDPFEGLVLSKYLENQKRQYIPNKLHLGDQVTAFISCFTFNHDSLNQFRLYGKENNLEVSGVSLVLREEFFNSASSTDFIGAITNNSLPVQDTEESQPNIPQKINDSQQIDKLPLYRCIYIDP